MQYRPLFTDATVEVGESYYYRVKAKNSGGESKPSNIIGPIRTRRLTLVDEMQNYSKLYSMYGAFTIENKNTRQAKEDIHRLKGRKGNFVIYQVPQPIESWKVYSFYPGRVSDLDFLVSSDGKRYTRVVAKKENFYTGAGGYEAVSYGYFKPVLYKAKDLPVNSRFLKIEFKTEVQISRVELYYGK